MKQPLVNNLFDLSGKKILITGASSGIGREIAVMAAQHGAEVIISGRNTERLAETIELIGRNTIAITADLTNEDDIKNLVSQLPDIDGVVFCAGLVEYTPLKFINHEKIKHIFSLNFDSQVGLTQQLIKNKRVRTAGALVYISSISSKIGIPATALYASSKAAINAFVKIVAAETGGQKIRANSICPGLIKTPMLEAAKDAATETLFEDAEKDYLLGVGNPVDVAGPVLFLLSDASKWITGIELIVDGGLLLK